MGDSQCRQVAEGREPQDRGRDPSRGETGREEPEGRAETDQAVDVVDVKRLPRCNVRAKAGGPIKTDGAL